MLLDFFDICDSFRNPKFLLQSWVHLALVVFESVKSICREENVEKVNGSNQRQLKLDGPRTQGEILDFWNYHRYQKSPKISF